MARHEFFNTIGHNLPFSKRGSLPLQRQHYFEF